MTEETTIIERPPQPPFDPKLEKCEWENFEWKVSYIKPVPSKINIWGFRWGMARFKQVDIFEAALNQLEEPERSIGLHRWNNRSTILRNWVLFPKIQRITGWTDRMIDEMFFEGQDFVDRYT